MQPRRNLLLPDVADRPRRVLGLGLVLALLALSPLGSGLAMAQEPGREVVTSWPFLDKAKFPNEEAPVNQWVFSTAIGSRAEGAALTAFIGAALKDGEANFDPDGGKGLAFTSAVSGKAYEKTRSLSWEDLKGGGDDYEVDGSPLVFQDRGEGPEEEDFSNDALVHLVFDGSYYADLELRFDVQVDDDTPATSVDVFVRTTGPGGVWYRSEAYNNISLGIDDEFNGSATIALPASLDGQSSIEIILNDFDENGNSDLEIDNVEISGTPLPNPARERCVSAKHKAVGRDVDCRFRASILALRRDEAIDASACDAYLQSRFEKANVRSGRYGSCDNFGDASEFSPANEASVEARLASVGAVSGASMSPCTSRLARAVSQHARCERNVQRRESRDRDGTAARQGCDQRLERQVNRLPSRYQGEASCTDGIDIAALIAANRGAAPSCPCSGDSCEAVYCGPLEELPPPDSPEPPLPPLGTISETPGPDSP